MKRLFVLIVILCVFSLTSVSAETMKFSSVEWQFVFLNGWYDLPTLPYHKQYLSESNTMYVPLRAFANAMKYKVVGYSDKKIDLSDMRTDEKWYASEYYNIETGEKFNDYNIEPVEILNITQAEYYKYFGVDCMYIPMEFYAIGFGFDETKKFTSVCDVFSSPDTVVRQLFNKFPDLKNGSVSAYYDIFNNGLIVAFAKDKYYTFSFFNRQAETLYYVDFLTGDVTKYSNRVDIPAWNPILKAEDTVAEVKKLTLSVDGKKEIVIDSVLIDGSNYVPIRALSEFLGYPLVYSEHADHKRIDLFNTNQEGYGAKYIGHDYGEFELVSIE